MERIAAMSNETKLDEAAEVAYDKGATPLFLAIEETRWRDAFEIADESPDQIPVWVRSMGTEDTAFGWALWRRLPIHEVGRELREATFLTHFLSLRHS